ncbi:hypothetical protein ACWX0P_27210 [Vibrio mediterranei]
MSTPIHVPNWRLNIERNRELTDELGCSPAAYLIGVNGCFDIEMSQPGQELTYLTQRQFTIVCDFTGEPKAEFKRDYSRARFLLRVARISEGKSIRYSEVIPTTKEDYVEFYDDFLKFFWLEIDSPDALTDIDRKTLNVAADILAWHEEARGLGDRNL